MAKTEDKNQYSGRGLHNSALYHSLKDEDGNLKGLLEIVKNDGDLVLQIRDEYVNIYYKGGNLAKIKSENSIQFDENYFNRETDKVKREKAKITDCRNEKNELLEKLKKSRDYKTYVSEMKPLMEEYWDWLKKERKTELKEKDMQHSLCINNTEKDTYTVIDLEFQISKISDYKYVKPIRPKGRYRNDEKISPRFDIVAVRNSDKQLCVIELKCGTGALLGKSGLGDHADSFEGTIKRNPTPFVVEIKNIIQDKIDLELLSEGFSINGKDPEFLFAFVTKDNDKDENGIIRSKEEQIQIMKDEIVRQKCSDYKVLFLKDDGKFRLE